MSGNRRLRVVVAGAAGQLGREIAERFAGGHDVTPLTRADVDLAQHDAVMRAIASARPDVVINCSAYNAVDRAEDDASAALAVNAFAVRSLARAAEEAGALLVHYSTDFVFDGSGTRPYTEEDEPAPRSVYGQSKLLGEIFARDAARHFVLRVESLFGGAKPQSSIDRIVAAVREGRDAPVFVDRVVSPSFVADVASATETLIALDAEPGLYHCVNDGHATWYELGEEIARQLGREAKLVPTRVADIKMRAPRPHYCALSNDKLAKAGVTMPSWQDAIRRHLQRSHPETLQP
jgi:dTDP-4-dehydrorhamnose reductase